MILYFLGDVLLLSFASVLVFIVLTPSGPGFEKLAQTQWGAESAPPY